MGFKQKTITENPLVFEISFKHPGAMGMYDKIIEALVKQFEELGASRDLDYKIGVI